MSERESSFIKFLSAIVGSLILAIVVGSVAFYRSTITYQAVQAEINRTTEIKIRQQEQKVETMRVEWREDQKETKENIDAIADRINELSRHNIRY